MNKVALIGKSVSYSYSKIVHTYIYQKYNLDFQYELISTDDFDCYMDKLKQSEYKGYNITIPYKELAFQKANIISSEVEAIGASNCLICKNSKILAYNTDYLGFNELIKNNKIELKDKRILILGNGGAAKAVYYALKEYQDNVYVVVREKTSKASRFKNVITYGEAKDYQVNVIINTTPPAAYIDIKDYLTGFYDKVVLIDVNYVSPTNLMKLFETSYDGFDMLIGQAVYAARYFYGLDIILTEEDKRKIRCLIWTDMENYFASQYTVNPMVKKWGLLLMELDRVLKSTWI